MKHLLSAIIFVVVMLPARADTFIDFDLQYPALTQATPTQKKVVTATFGEIHGVSDPHLHTGIDCGVNDAKLIAVCSGEITTGTLGSSEPFLSALRYVDLTHTLNLGGGEVFQFTIRYLHCDLKPSFKGRSSVDVGEEFAEPLGLDVMSPAGYDAPHLHFEIYPNGHVNGNPDINANPLYNGVFSSYFNYPGFPPINNTIAVDLFSKIGGWAAAQRRREPLTNGTVDHYPINFKGVTWDEVTTRTNRQGLPIVNGNAGPIVNVIDTGVVSAESGGLGAGCTLYRLLSRTRKDSSQNYTTDFEVAFDSILRDEKRRQSDIFRPGTPNYGNNDRLYLYKKYAGNSLSMHHFGSSAGYYASKAEGRNRVQFLGLGYEAAYESYGAVSAGMAYVGGEDEFEIIVDNNSNPLLNKLKAYQQRMVGSWTLVYEWNNGSAITHDEFYSGSKTRFLLSFSEDAYVDSSTRLTIGSNNLSPLTMEPDPNKGSAFGQAPTGVDEPIESYWLLEFPPTNMAGTATLNLNANDLADNAVSVSGSINLPFILKSGAEEWRSYR
jgi:hypothetical protein